MFRTTLVLVMLAIVVNDAFATDKQFLVSKKEDDITGAMVHSITMIGDDSKSTVSISVAEKKRPVLTIRPADVIFPDISNIESKVMGVSITMRSNLMESATTRAWAMGWMDYKSASTFVSPEEARILLTGESVTFQFDKVGKRYRFGFTDKNTEGITDAIEEVLSHAATQADLDKERINELLKKQQVAESKPAMSSLPSKEELQKQFDVSQAIKNGTADGATMATQIPFGVLKSLREPQVIARAKKAADFRGIKKDSDPRRKPYIDAYVEAIENARR